MSRRRSVTPRPARFIKNREGDAEFSPRMSFQVKSEPGGWFHFIALVTDPRTGAQWVDAYGGTGRGVTRVASHRSFPLDRVKRYANGQLYTRPHKTKENDE